MTEPEYLLHNTTKAVETRQLVQSQPERLNNVLLIGGGDLRIVRQRPLQVTHSVLLRYLPELLEQQTKGRLKITSLEGGEVDPAGLGAKPVVEYEVSLSAARESLFKGRFLIDAEAAGYDVAKLTPESSMFKDWLVSKGLGDFSREELTEIIRKAGVDLAGLSPETFEELFSTYVTGGLEAVLAALPKLQPTEPEIPVEPTPNDEIPEFFEDFAKKMAADGYDLSQLSPEEIQEFFEAYKAELSPPTDGQEPSAETPDAVVTDETAVEPEVIQDAIAEEPSDTQPDTVPPPRQQGGGKKKKH